jgi:hypothetical protein
MVVEDHPLYAEWKAALEMVIATREVRDTHRIGCKQYEAANVRYQDALAAYDTIGRKV